MKDGGKVAGRKTTKRGSRSSALRLWCSAKREGEVFLQEHDIPSRIGLGLKQHIAVLEAETLKYAERDIYVLEVPDIEGFLARTDDDDSVSIETMQMDGREIRFAWLSVDALISEDEDGETSGRQSKPLDAVTRFEAAREDRPFDGVDSEDTENLDFGGTEVHLDLFVIERSSGGGDDWDGSSFVAAAARASGVISRGQRIPKRVSVFDVAGRYLIEQLDRVSPDLHRASQAGAFLAEIHTHAGELLLKEFSLREELEALQRELEDSPFFRASQDEDEPPERTQEALAVLNDAHQSLGRANERLKQALEFTKTNTEAAGLHADLALNRAMLFLTVVTVAAGILPMMDKYQSDRTFGIDAPTGLHRIMIVGSVLLLFTLISIREPILRWVASFGCLYGLADWVLYRSYAAWQFFRLSSVAKQAAWAMSSEHLQRLHLFHAPALRSAVLDAEPYTLSLLERAEGALLSSLESVAVSVGWLSVAADDADGSQSGKSAQGRMVAARDATRFVLRWCSLILEPARTLPPAEEVGYWILVKAATLELKQSIDVGHMRLDSTEFHDNYAPWTDSRSLALRVGGDFLLDEEQVAQLKVRLDRAAKRVLDSYGTAPLPVEGALERLFETRTDDEEYVGRERFSLHAWLSAAVEEGLALRDLLEQRMGPATRSSGGDVV